MVLLTLLLAMAIGAVGLLAAAQVWTLAAQRDAEEELLFVGNAYRDAIRSYYLLSPGGARVYPSRIEDLVLDDRFPVPVRHLRRAYADPLSGGPFELVMAGNQITGVVSSSKKGVIKKTGFTQRDVQFEACETYDQWLFVFRPTLRRN